jgi:competence protein ComEC
MAFQTLGIGHYQYDDGTGAAEYYEVECGGGGNCLYLSLAWLLAHHRIEVTDHGTLRQRASALLVQWQGTLPEHIDNYNVVLPSSLLAANKAGNDREYGTLASVVALVEHSFANGDDLEVHVLGPEEADVTVYRCPLALDQPPAFRIHLYYLSYIHYRALVVKADVNAVPAGMVVANSDADVIVGAKPKPKKLSASLLVGGSDSSKNNTHNAALGARLEIHTIDVGQGEATLILIWNGAGAIVKSILIDTGVGGDKVTAYLNTLIAKNAFRPIDLFFVSHYDNDHIGGARAVLDDPTYTNSSVLIYDSGVPKQKNDNDYVEYVKNKRGANRRLPPLDKPVLEDCEGVTLRCLYRNGLMASRDDIESEYDGLYSLEMSDNLDSEDVLDSGEMQSSFYPTDKNDCSLALLLQFGNFRYLTAGDLSGKYEVEVAQSVQETCGYVSMFKAGHHGAGESTRAETLTLLKPRLVTISCGFNNTHGHPNQSCVQRLEDLGGKVAMDYLVTGDIADEKTASGKGFPAFPAGDHGAANAGTIVVTVTDVGANAAPHVFDAFSTGYHASIRCTCEDRSATKIVKVPSFDLKRKRRNSTVEEQQQRKLRHEREKQELLESAKKFLEDQVRRRFGSRAEEFLKKENMDEWARLLLKNNKDDDYWATSAPFKNLLQKCREELGE